MRAREFLFEDTKVDKEAKDLIQKVDNPDAIKKAVDYLKNLLAKIKPQQEPEPEEAEEVTEDINGDKQFAMAAIEELSKSGNTQELNAIISFLRRAELLELANSAIKAQLSAGVAGGLDQRLADLVMKVNTTFDEKEKFLSHLASGKGFWDGSDLLNGNTGNIYKKLDSIPVLKDIYKTISKKFRGAMGYGPDQGPGEFLLALTGEGVDLADKSDLVLVDGKGVEVKADNGGIISPKTGKKSRAGGRLYATSGYGNAGSSRVIMYKKMRELGVPEEVLNGYGWPNKKSVPKGTKVPLGGLNFNVKGIENLNKLFSEYLDAEGARQVMAGALKGMYTELPDKLASTFLNNVLDGNQIISEPVLNTEFIALGNDYYKMKEGHDYIMVFNTTSGGYLMINNANDVRKLMKSGALTHTGGFDMHDDRSKGTPQLITDI